MVGVGGSSPLGRTIKLAVVILFFYAQKRPYQYSLLFFCIIYNTIPLSFKKAHFYTSFCEHYPFIYLICANNFFKFYLIRFFMIYVTNFTFVLLSFLLKTTMSFILNTSIIITNNKFYKSLRFQNIRKQRI